MISRVGASVLFLTVLTPFLPAQPPHAPDTVTVKIQRVKDDVTVTIAGPVRSVYLWFLGNDEQFLMVETHSTNGDSTVSPLHEVKKLTIYGFVLTTTKLTEQEFIGSDGRRYVLSRGKAPIPAANVRIEGTMTWISGEPFLLIENGTEPRIWKRTERKQK